MVKDYKSSRIYYNDNDVTAFDQDSDPVKYFSMKSNAEFNRIKNHAKYSICKFFPKFGLPVIISEGYEADDLAYIAAQNFKDYDKKIAIVSVDSDWTFRINPNCDMITPKGKVITYNDMITKVPEGWTLYEYHKYNDTLYGGHNDLHNTMNDEGSGLSLDELKSAIENDKSELFRDIDLVKLQLSTFDIYNFPDIDMITSLITEDRLDSIGSFYNLDEFSKNCFFNVSRSYYAKFLSTINPELFNK
jgi:hypothetical protein